MATSTCKAKYDDEPTFTICGRDLLAAPVIKHWLELAERKGVNYGKITTAEHILDTIIKFQREHPERCKIPD